MAQTNTLPQGIKDFAYYHSVDSIKANLQRMFIGYLRANAEFTLNQELVSDYEAVVELMDCIQNNQPIIKVAA